MTPKSQSSVAVRLACASALALVFSLAGERDARAIQPLEEFLEKSRTYSFDAREVEATLRQREAEAESALGRLLPALTARGVYTRNQYEVAIATAPGAPQIVIQPQNQLDAFFQLDVPILDVSGYYRYRAARALGRVASEQREATALDVARNVSRAYFQLIGAYGLVQASEKSVATAESNLRDVEIRRSAGAATELDRERARANLERARQDLSDAQLLVSLSARNLETLSGLTPTPADRFPADDLQPEAPLREWLAKTGETPQERAAREASQAASDAKKSATFALLPTLSGSAQERITNATGFSGRTSTYLLQLALTWRLDYATYANSEAQAAARDVAVIREERARRAITDLVFEAHRRVEAGIVKSRAARAQAQAAAHAAELAQDRYTAGAATQLDVTQAQRDAFLADASRVQADADLFYARAALRIAAGALPTLKNGQRTP